MNEGTDAEGGVRVDLFGGPSVSTDDEGLELTQQQKALLTVLFAHGPEGVARPRLGWLMWEEDESPRLRQRIRQLLHRTHERIGRTIVVAEDDTLRPAHGVSNDVERFEGLLRRGSLAEAAGLLSHGFARRLGTCPTDAFEDWLASRRTRLLEDLRRSASRRWDETSEAGLWGEARDAAEALYMHFPADEAVVARVIESRARTGSLASAEAVFARFRASRGDEDVPDEITALMERARKLQAAPHIALQEGEPHAPVVGRGEEIANARAAFGNMGEGDFRFVLITGEGGIGKTRVIEEVRREALLEGFRCIHARPSEPEQRIPLNPFADAFEDVDLAGHLRALGAPWRSVIASLLPIDDDEPLEEIPPIQEAHLSRRLMDALFLLMQRIAAEEPTILFIDDLQWADATTLTALQFIQRRWEHGPLAIVAAAREDLLEASEPGSNYLFRKDDFPVVRVDLTELDSEDGHRLVDHLIDGPVDHHVAARLCELAGLHPLYLTELAKDFGAGRLSLPEVPVDEVAIPVSLQEIFRARLRLLSSTATKVAGLLAVRAKPMRLAEIGELTGLPVEHCADCAEELTRLRLVELDKDTLRIAHELFRSALYQHLSEARRAVLHRAIAEQLKSRPEEGVAGELAMHYARAGEREPAAEHGWSAATAAVEHGAVAEAAYFFELVVENEDDEGRRARATAELARALHLNRAIERANPLLELASLRLRQTGDPTRALRMDIRRVEGLAEVGSAPINDLIGRLAAIKDEARQMGDWEALALALDAELQLRHSTEDLLGIRRLFDEMRQVTRDGPTVASAIAHSGLALGILFGDYREALQSARTAVQECDPESQHRLRILLRLLLVLQYQGLFYSAEATELVREARSLAKTSGDLLLRFNVESNVAVAHLDTGDLDAAEVLMAQSTEMLGSAELSLNRFNQANNCGELALAQRDYPRAKRCFHDAAQYIGMRTPPYAAKLVHAGLGLCAAETGDLRTAKEHEAQLSDMPTFWYFDPTLILAFRSRMHQTRQEYSEASELLAVAADDLQDRLVLAWLKIRKLHAQLESKRNVYRAQELAEEGLACARTLGLKQRTSEFAAIIRKLSDRH
ncbi:MAG: AAA family ATPase [Gemmatimonadota bacterium]|nr:AAA family ATPase [Gemmatimonadota bacterium]